MARKTCFLFFFLLTTFLLLFFLPTQVSATCDYATQESCSPCDIHGTCGSIWKYCTYIGTDSDTGESCTYGEDTLCSGDPTSCGKPLSCNCGDSGHEKVDCVSGASCTGSYGDGCNYCQSWFKAACQPNGTCAPVSCSPGESGCGTVDPCAGISCPNPSLAGSCSPTAEEPCRWREANGDYRYEGSCCHRICQGSQCITIPDSDDSDNDCDDDDDCDNPTPPPSPPPPPTGLTASCPTPGTTASLSWNSVSSATSYLLRVDDSPSSWNGSCNPPNSGDICINQSETTKTFTSIPGHTYSWWLHACNNAGCSDPPTDGSAFTCIAACVLLPTGLSSQMSDILCNSRTATVSLSWDNQSDAQSYYIRANATDGSTGNIQGPVANNCPANADGSSVSDLCINRFSGNSMRITVATGKTYRWWVHSYSNANPACLLSASKFGPEFSPTASPCPSTTPAPAPPTPTVTLPTCITANYNGSGINFSWRNNAVPATWIDIIPSGATTYYHKALYGTANTNASTNGTGFNDAMRYPPTLLIYRPSFPYAVRLWNGSQHSDSTVFTTPVLCPAPTPTPCPIVDGKWGNWENCSTLCKQTRSCINPIPACGGKACLKDDGTRGLIETKECACSSSSPSWIQVTGDVHSNSGIDAEGGP